MHAAELPSATLLVKGTRKCIEPFKNTLVNQLLLLEDNYCRPIRRSIAGVSDGGCNEVQVRLHRIDQKVPEVLAEDFCPLATSNGLKQKRKATVALELLDSINPHPEGVIVVAGTAYGCLQQFIRGLQSRHLNFVVELRPSTRVRLETSEAYPDTTEKIVVASSLLPQAQWLEIPIVQPLNQQNLNYLVADLTSVLLPAGGIGRLFAAQKGSIRGIHRDTIFALSSAGDVDLKELLQIVSWARWIRPLVRKQERSRRETSESKLPALSKKAATDKFATLAIRANITLARQQDQKAVWKEDPDLCKQTTLDGVLCKSLPVLNVVELFAGAGAMGLGFLMAARDQRRYRITFSGEVHPIYVETLKHNHNTVSQRYQLGVTDPVPEQVQPLDLRTDEALEAAEGCAKEVGGVHILIGGPPCQGFSSSNRSSRHSENPHNQHVNTFLRYVERLKPLVFLMENVQGILWMPKAAQTSPQIKVVDWVVECLQKAGYLVFPKLLDAVWYGVPQYRSRFFLLGIHEDLGYKIDDFGAWGPFPIPTHGPGTSLPYLTVKDAMADLPCVGNGWIKDEMPYDEPLAEEFHRNPFLCAMREGAPQERILDHVTSRHADYVIDRYKLVPPGGNWESIAEQLTNYTDVQRTHSNIYRRLRWDEPSITIGHYRKSMLIHPSQDRGLSLREASRLQSIPDWFRFAGSINGATGGLMHKQQQLANAVCPFVTKAVAEFILGL